MLYEVRNMSGALLMVLASNGISLAAISAANAAKLYGMADDRIVRTADLGKLPSGAAVAAERFGEWINPEAVKQPA